MSNARESLLDWATFPVRRALNASSRGQFLREDVVMRTVTLDERRLSCRHGRKARVERTAKILR